MTETQKEAERQQQTLGIWSWVFITMEAFFFILTAVMPTKADWGYFLVMSMGILVLATLGIVVAIIGLTRPAESFRKTCTASAVTGVIVLGIAGLFTLVMAFISI